MELFQVELLGPPMVRRTGSAPTPVPASVQPLLAYLSLESQAACHRERIIDVFWPDASTDQGRRRLNTAVWRARSLFGTERTRALVVTNGYVALDPAMVEVDIWPTIRALSQENRAAARHGNAEATDTLRRAVRVDPGRFLAGNYDEWVVRTRHQLEIDLVGGVATLLECASGPGEAIEWAEMLVRLDPLREDVHRTLIGLYASHGRRADALKQYETCVRRLREDLDVEPLVETTLAVSAVREGLVPLPAGWTDVGSVLPALRQALAVCQVIVDQLEPGITAPAFDR